MTNEQTLALLREILLKMQELGQEIQELIEPGKALAETIEGVKTIEEFRVLALQGMYDFIGLKFELVSLTLKALDAHDLSSAKKSRIAFLSAEVRLCLGIRVGMYLMSR